MNLHDAARELWREKLVVVGCAVVAAAIAILATFHVSLSPPSLRVRALQLGVAQGSVLIDGNRSLLGNVRINPNRLDALGANFADLSDSAPIIDRIAHSLHVAPSSVGVQPQVTAQVPLSQSQPLEPQVGTQILQSRRHFLLVARNDLGTPIVQYYAQAPTGAQAVTMVRSAVHAMHSLVAERAHGAHVLPRDELVVRSLGLVSGQTLDSGVSRDAAILIGLLVWALLVIAYMTIRSQARRSAAVRRLAAPQV